MYIYMIRSQKCTVGVFVEHKKIVTSSFNLQPPREIFNNQLHTNGFFHFFPHWVMRSQSVIC